MIVDITNYIMLSVGQPTHGFDRTHVDGSHIIVRNAKKDEKLILLDHALLDLTEEDLVICDEHDPMALAGIRGGIKDSILPETTGVVIEVATFTAGTIRQTGKRFDEKTDASIRYEKGLDTQRVDQGIAMAAKLFRRFSRKAKSLPSAMCIRLRLQETKLTSLRSSWTYVWVKALPSEEILDILTRLGYDVTLTDGTYHCVVPTYRSTGDVSVKDDVLGDIARVYCYENFEMKPLPVNFEHAVRQPKEQLDRKNP